jgi:hypothetical protein
VQGQGRWPSGERDEQGRTRPNPHEHPRAGRQAGRQARLGHSLPSEKLAGAVSQRTDSHDIEGSLPPHPLSLHSTARFPTEQNRGRYIDGLRDSDQTSRIEMKLAMRLDFTTKPTLICIQLLLAGRPLLHVHRPTADPICQARCDSRYGVTCHAESACNGL